MSRSLHVAAVFLACAALAPACFLTTGPFETDATGGTGAAGGTGGTGAAGGTGGTGGMMAVCGDGVISGIEQCDDAGTAPLDGCGPGCVIEAGWACAGEPSMCAKTCGDGKLDTGEACDDDNLTLGDGCNQGCQIEAGFECDGAEPSVCHRSCGDGTLDGGEVCDDNNVEPGDGCDALCKAETGWTCDQPGDDPNQPSTCMTICGDGILAGTEVCDDADTDDTNGCKGDCSAINPGWDCPGGGPACTTTCGDGIPAGDDEDCDDGNLDAYDGCSGQCKLESTCGNGIVDPGEACDGGAECDMCTPVAGTICAGAVVIPPDPAGVDTMTGVRTTTFEGDSSSGTVADGDVAPQNCHSFKNAVLHSYTTGKAPSLVTLHTLPTLVGGDPTFKKTVVWAYRDCPGKKDVEGCDSDSAPMGDYSLFTTGFLPAQTTLFIVVAGDGMGDKGPYRLEVTEQPVKVFFHEDFGADPTSGIFPPPPDLTLQVTAPGADWVTCVNSIMNPCTGITLNSHSGGAFGIGHVPMGMGDTVTSTAGLATPQVNVAGLTVARAQYTFRFNHATGSNDSGSVVPINNTTPDMAAAKTYTMTESGRAFVNLPNSPLARVAFVYDDGANASAGKFSVDDIVIYGY